MASCQDVSMTSRPTEAAEQGAAGAAYPAAAAVCRASKDLLVGWVWGPYGTRTDWTSGDFNTWHGLACGSTCPPESQGFYPANPGLCSWETSGAACMASPERDHQDVQLFLHLPFPCNSTQSQGRSSLNLWPCSCESLMGTCGVMFLWVSKHGGETRPLMSWQGTLKVIWKCMPVI